MRGKVVRLLDNTKGLGITPAYAGKSADLCICSCCIQDHPRLCGEKVFAYPNICKRTRITPAYAGKSGVLSAASQPDTDHPRLCGEKMQLSLDKDGMKRITPAYAGKSLSQRQSGVGQRDHPRLCGEKFLSALALDLPKGSPPPMRGKESYCIAKSIRMRITPAYAGKSHPLLPPPFHDVGSPPPMRGKVVRLLNDRKGLRITPAYAGKSRKRRSCSRSLKDHPRLCGEKISLRVFAVPLLGSPPPMRGKGTLRSNVEHTNGITPAYAGKSAGDQSGRRGNQDHPRLCGEKLFPIPQPRSGAGSPPPMRGKDMQDTISETSKGITPAYAGKSFTTQLESTKDEDHPRLCGEKIKTFLQSRGAWGSPPPMRGKVGRLDSVLTGFGITPAYAGKSHN